MVNKKKIQAPRGLKDVLPVEQKYWFWLENNFYNIFGAAGFDRIIIPTFESTDLFKRSVGEFTDIVSKEMYTFKDKSGNSLTLRPEGTAGVVRAYIEHGMHTLSKPVKLFYWGPMFRYSRPQAGRYREFWQFGLEVLDDDTPLSDALLIQSLYKYYIQIGLKDVIIKINSLGTVKSRIKMISSLAKFLTKHKKDICVDCQQRIKHNPLRILDCKQSKCKNITQEASMVLIDNLDDLSKNRFTKVLEYLDEMQVNYELAPSLVRGLDYYTHTVFEIIIGNKGLSIGGGGRYDNLVKQLGGLETPCVGYAGGIERTIDALKQQSVIVPEIVKADIFVVQLGIRAKDKSIKIINDLEAIGLKIAGSFGSGSIQAQLKQANKLNVPFVIIIGDQEVRDGSIILRDMTDRSQEIVLDRNMLKMITNKLEEKGIKIT